MQDAFRIGESYHVEPSLNSVIGPSGTIRLEPKVMQVLVCLAAHGGQVVSKERLMQTVWPDTFVGDDVLIRAISELRRAFEDDPKHPRFIQTIAKGGYRLLPDRVGLSGAESESRVDPVRPAPRNSTQRVQWLVMATAITLVIGGVVWRWSRPHVQGNSPTLAATRSVPLTALPGAEIFPAFSPDGKEIAFSWNGGEGPDFRIYVKLVNAGEPLRLSSGPGGDMSPAWSPDGRYIAFARCSSTEKGVFIVPALGGAERKVRATACDRGFEDANVAWSPDGTLIAFPDRRSPQDAYGIWLLSVNDLQTRRLTSPAADSGGDGNPSFSPDGRLVAFDRTVSAWAADLYVVPTSGGEPRRLSFDEGHAFGPAWTPDGRHIVEWSSRQRRPGFWSIPVDGGAPPQWLFGGDLMFSASISRDGHSLAYTHQTFDTNIWRLELNSGPPESSSRLQTASMRGATKITSSTRQEQGPQFSPDGRRIVFSSGQSGNGEIWVCDSDGRNALQLTSFGGRRVGTPRWSHDGQQIAFDSAEHGKSDIYVIGAMGGTPRRVLTDRFNNMVPSWSGDGRWIYFASNRSGANEVWKVPVQGGEPVQVTKHGGFAAFETPDGARLLYAKFDQPGIWSATVDGDDERLVLDRLVPGMWGYWGVAPDGIYFLDPEDRQHPTIEFFSFHTKRVTGIARMDHGAAWWNPGLAVSPDGHQILYTQIDQDDSDLELVSLQ